MNGEREGGGGKLEVKTCKVSRKLFLLAIVDRFTLRMVEFGFFCCTPVVPLGQLLILHKSAKTFIDR